MRSIKILLASVALVALSAGLAFADVPPPEEDDDGGGCAAGETSSGIIGALALGVVVLRRRG